MVSYAVQAATQSAYKEYSPFSTMVVKHMVGPECVIKTYLIVRIEGEAEGTF